MTTRLELICHASTRAVRSSAFPDDEPLDAFGREKAARSLRPVRADVYLCSPALRAMQTAELLDLPVIVAADLRDCDYGRWAGRTLDDVQYREPEAVAEWLHDPDAAPHGGETVSALIARVGAWLDQRRGNGRTVAVTHASVMRAAVVHALGAPARSFWRIDVAPLSAVRLNGDGGRWTLSSLGGG